MAELTQKERLQPSLLDRLTDDEVGATAKEWNRVRGNEPGKEEVLPAPVGPAS